MFHVKLSDDLIQYVFEKIDVKCNYYSFKKDDSDTVKKFGEDIYLIVGKIFGITLQRKQLLNIKLDPLILLIIIK